MKILTPGITLRRDILISISLCMIVKDEADTLARCLESVKDIVDEIIIVDTGSTDKTKEIASKYTEDIYDFEWVDDFSVARNYSFSKATKEYVMWLDADDVILEADCYQFVQFKKTFEADADTIIMRYDLTSETAAVVASFYRERIVKRSSAFKWQDPVHEYILVSGTYQQLDIAITHMKKQTPTRRNLEILEKYIAKGNTLSKRNWFYYARELFQAGEFEKAAGYYQKFLDTKDGLLSNYLDCCIDLSWYYAYKEDDKNSLLALLRYFEKDGPRAEICCSLGYYYKDRKDYEKAISWFKLAPHTTKPESLGVVKHDYWSYIPYMELSLCSCKLGKIEEAIYYNERAAKARPDDRKACHNRTCLGCMKEQMISKTE